MYVNLDVTTIRHDDPGNPDMEEADVQVEKIEKVFLAKVRVQPGTACDPQHPQHPGSTKHISCYKSNRTEAVLASHRMASVICRPLASP